MKLQQLSGCAALAYESGILELDDLQITQIGGMAIQARNNSTIFFQNSSISETGETVISLQSNVKGYLKNIQATSGKHGALAILDVSEFTVENCKFFENEAFGIALENSSVKLNNIESINNGDFSIEIKGSGETVIENSTFTGAKQVGVHITGGANPSIRNCVVEDGLKFGIDISDASGIIENSKIRNNGDAGLSIYQGSTTKIANCEISGNGTHGAQIHQPNTNPSFSNCKFFGHSKGLGVLGLTNAHALFVDCEFQNSFQHHFQISGGVEIILDNCQLSKTQVGHSIQIAAGAKLIAKNKTLIHHETKVGVIIGGGGTFELEDSTIEDCGQGGIAIMNQGNLKVSKSTIQNNGQFGVNAQPGSIAEIKDTTVQGHSLFGLIISTTAKVDYGNNKFANNLQKDVHVQ